MHTRAHPHTRVLPHRSPWKASRTLVVRGGAARTFGGLVAFIAALFLGGGLYLIGDAFVHPVTAHDTGVLGGALTIALGAVLFFYLLRPGGTHHAGRSVPRPATDGVAEHDPLLVYNGSRHESALHNGNVHESPGHESTGRNGNAADTSATPGESPGNSVPLVSAGGALRGPR
jgi:hypothetical protein